MRTAASCHAQLAALPNQHHGKRMYMQRTHSLRPLAKLVAFAAIAILATALVSACGSDSSSSKDSSSDTPAATTSDTSSSDSSDSAAADNTLEIDVKSGTMEFEKTEATAKAGKITITSKNPDAVPHNIAIEGNGVKEEGELVTNGDTSTITVDLKPGTYEFYCTPHRTIGMKGTLTVT